MRIERITTRNAVYQKFEVLKTNRNKRHKYHQFFVEGVRNINEAVKNHWKIVSFLYTKDRELSGWANGMIHNIDTEVNYDLSLELMNELSNKEDTSELLAIVEMREDSFNQIVLSKCPILALFDRPSNKGNLGTILRSCDALGVDGLIITGHAVDLYNPDVIVSSMGSFFHVPAIRVADNEQIYEFIHKMKTSYHDFITVGTTSHKQTALASIDLTRPVMFLIGNETEGLCHAFKEACDMLATIPMAETSAATSFNVGCAASIMFYEAIRQRTI